MRVLLLHHSKHCTRLLLSVESTIFSEDTEQWERSEEIFLILKLLNPLKSEMGFFSLCFFCSQLSVSFCKIIWCDLHSFIDVGVVLSLATLSKWTRLDDVRFELVRERWKKSYENCLYNNFTCTQRIQRTHPMEETSAVVYCMHIHTNMVAAADDDEEANDSASLFFNSLFSAAQISFSLNAHFQRYIHSTYNAMRCVHTRKFPHSHSRFF